LNFRHNPLRFYRPAFQIANASRPALRPIDTLPSAWALAANRAAAHYYLVAMRIELRSEYLNVRHSTPPKRRKNITNENMLNDARTKSRMRELSIFCCHDASRFHE
jgi:hypothetical protein